MSSEDLQNAYNLIRDGQRAEAVSILLPLVRADPLSADGWWLLANAVDDPDQQRQALERVLKLRPDDDRARRMLNKLSPTDSPISEDRPRKRKNDDAADFSDFDEDRVRVRRKKRGASPLTLILAAIGLIVAISCALCLGLAVITVPSVKTVVEQVVLTVTFEPGFATLANLGTALPTHIATPEPRMQPSDAMVRGSITPGQTIHPMLAFSDDLWTFRGEAGQSIIVAVESADPALSPQVYLYNSDKQILARADNNAHAPKISLEYKLSVGGTYTIDIAAFGDQADYTLTLTTK